ncbi:PEP/pyruvate-binding domain-containing protein [Actinocatenispora sera]|uniref:PEP/pyruvate-binding domain-containing protein n=1 Tax=Actinocatenispora sera TaxID=390989 RepID=UPI0033F14C7A
MWVPLASADERHGTKAATLARLTRAGFAVPDGVVTADPEEPGGRDAIPPVLRALGGTRFAVRSSARGEDGARASFAGQLHTTLNVPAAGVVDAVHRTAVSARAGRVAAYAARTARGIGTAVPVIVQVMVDARVAGVAFTRHPVTGADRIVLEAVRGLGDRLVDGTTTPQRWTLDRAGGQATGTEVLTPRQAEAITDTARRIEAALGDPQDIEWAIAGGQVWVLQARPITTVPAQGPALPASGRPLVTGTPSSPGAATGRVRVVGGLDDFDRFAAGEVLVCHATSPAWTPLLARAAAVVTETGGILAHAAIVAREFAIPAVTAATGAMARLTDGRRVIVDGTTGTVTAPNEEPIP